jgi:hypothetical protein
VAEARPPAEDGAAIALMGSFNPPIFHPQWFARHDFIGREEAEDAHEVQVDEFVSVFEARWFAFHVDRRQLSISSTPASQSYLPLGDLAGSVFEVLSHTPITGVAMFRFRHARLGGEGWPALARRVAKLDVWDSVVPSPKLSRLTIEAPLPAIIGAPAGTVILEPSRLLDNAVFVSVIAEFGAPLEDDPSTPSAYWGDAGEATSLLRTGWGQLLEQADLLIDEVQRWA